MGDGCGRQEDIIGSNTRFLIEDRRPEETNSRQLSSWTDIGSPIRSPREARPSTSDDSSFHEYRRSPSTTAMASLRMVAWAFTASQKVSSVHHPA